jgi:uncharacterized repeat protein (TIGR01451 family)
MVGEVRTLTVTVRNTTRRTAYDLYIRAFPASGLRVISHSRRAIVQRGKLLWRVTTLRSRKSRTIQLTVVPTRSVRGCTTVTANAVLRNLSSRRACIRAIRVRAPTSGLG